MGRFIFTVMGPLGVNMGTTKCYWVFSNMAGMMFIHQTLDTYVENSASLKMRPKVRTPT